MGIEHKDFAKILRATNGQQVLVYLEDCTEKDDICCEMKCVARFDGYTGSTSFAFDDEAKAEKSFNEFANTELADYCVKTLGGFMTTDVEG